MNMPLFKTAADENEDDFSREWPEIVTEGNLDFCRLFSDLVMYCQTIWTHIRLLPRKQSDQGSLCLLIKYICIYATDLKSRRYAHDKSIGGICCFLSCYDSDSSNDMAKSK